MALLAQSLANCGAAGMLNGLETHPKLINTCRETGLEVVLDSGAYQGNTNIIKYAGKIIKFGDLFTWFANLDVRGDQAASNANYEKLLELVPSNLHPKILWVYQYSPESLDDLPRYVREHGPYIGVGNLVPLLIADIDKAEAAIDQCVEIIEAEGGEPHLFGVGNYRLITKYANKKGSCDSTKWLQGVKTRSLINERGETITPAKIKELGLNFTRIHRLEQNIISTLQWGINSQPAPALITPINDPQQELWSA